MFLYCIFAVIFFVVVVLIIRISCLHTKFEEFTVRMKSMASVDYVHMVTQSTEHDIRTEVNLLEPDQ